MLPKLIFLICRSLKCVFYRNNDCKLITAHYTLHTAHCTLHTTHNTLHTSHCTLQTEHCTALQTCEGVGEIELFLITPGLEGGCSCSPPTALQYTLLSAWESQVDAVMYHYPIIKSHVHGLRTSHFTKGNFVRQFFTESAPLGRFNYIVDMFGCLSVCLSVYAIRCNFFRHLIGPEVTWSFPGLSLVLPPSSTISLGSWNPKFSQDRTILGNRNF